MQIAFGRRWTVMITVIWLAAGSAGGLGSPQVIWGAPVEAETVEGETAIRLGLTLASVPSGLEDVPPALQVIEGVPDPLGSTPGLGGISLDGADLPSVLSGWPAIDAPAGLRSSGTGFRRGLWYVEQDVVILTRDFHENAPLGPLQQLGTVSINGRNVTLPFPTGVMRIKSTAPGAAANARLSLGRFLFRDDVNNDHWGEFRFFGLGDWFDEGSLNRGQLNQQANANLPPDITGQDAVETAYTYVTELDSYEVNYVLRHRARRDRMILEPDSEWVRQVNPSLLHSYVFGVRLIQMDEQLRYRSTGVSGTGTEARMRTSNDLVGFQIGGDVIYKEEVWSAGVRGKAGTYVNFSSQNTDFRIFDSMTSAEESVRADKDAMAFQGELTVYVSYDILPNASFRVAFEAMWLNSLALAPHQINSLGAAVPAGVIFVPPNSPSSNYMGVVDPFVSVGGTQLYLGMSTGLEFYW